MALSVRMGPFLVDPLMGLPTCARRCFKVFFGHAVLPRKFCASKPAVRQARQSLWGLAQGNRTTMAFGLLAVASRIHSERDVLKCTAGGWVGVDTRGRISFCKISRTFSIRQK